MKIDDILVPINRPLDEVERKYRDLFIKHMKESFNYIPKSGETIGQWLCKAAEYHYYNPKKFQSSEGFCFTVSKKGIKITPPFLGRSKRFTTNLHIDRWTDYVKANVTEWKKYYSEKRYPTRYLYKNSYPSSYGLSEKPVDVAMHTVTLLYARPETEWDSIISAEAIHHIIPMDWSQPPHFSNYAKNLQVIDSTSHGKMHKESEKFENRKWEQEVAEKTKDFSKTIIAGDLTDIFESLLGGTHLDGYVSVHNEDGSIAMLQHFGDVSEAVGSVES